MGDNEWLKVVQRSMLVKDNFLNIITKNRKAKLFDPTPISGRFNLKLTNILESFFKTIFLKLVFIVNIAEIPIIGVKQ